MLYCAIILTVGHAFLFDGPEVKCPHPAQNCKNEHFNRVITNYGCLGCQEGCQPNHVMTANPRYFIRHPNDTGHYSYQGILVPHSINVSEPEWLCLPGTECHHGYYQTSQGNDTECAYCGEGCLSCHSYHECNQCVLGYRPHKHTIAGGGTASVCISSGVMCPNPPAHCAHDAYVSQVVGCLGCMVCEPGYIAAANPNYRRPAENRTSGYYDYKGIRVSGSLEITQPRYTCVSGPPCPAGWHAHNATHGVETCELDPTTAATTTTAAAKTATSKATSLATSTLP